MVEQNQRNFDWQSLGSTPWDIIIIGGGITGAGILREASQAGLRALLLEAKDFASGTSSRSSKLVHGGLRYLKNAQIKLTVESVHERERLLKEGRGLVNPLGFLLANYQGDSTPGWVFGAGLILYDLLALKWGHRQYDTYDMLELCPPLAKKGLRGGYRYFDAQTDDARLVLRLIAESQKAGAKALNYARVTGLLQNHAGQVRGVVIEDQDPENQGRTTEAQAAVVINATGAWADELRLQVGGVSRLRKLRGSHLVFPAARLPITRAVTFLHPKDGRPVFAFPWEGVALIGTTDVDHDPSLDLEPAISAAEVEYLLQAVQQAFSAQELAPSDVLATLAGVRPVINTGKADPSKESREHVLWNENGLLTITGGKLTTFRLMALEVLHAARSRLPEKAQKYLSNRRDQRIFDAIPADTGLDLCSNRPIHFRLLGRYGNDISSILAEACRDNFEMITGTPYLWAELAWAASSENVIHLDDLLLRRLRLGLILPEGGLPIMDRIQAVAQARLKWNDQRWEQEVREYTRLWKQCYHLS